MELEDLYSHIFDISEIPQHPAYHGFSYGVLMVENDRPMVCFYLDDNADRKLQYVLSHGMIEIYSMGGQQTQLYYGYVTHGERFFCEEQVYPRQNQKEGGLL